MIESSEWRCNSSSEPNPSCSIAARFAYTRLFCGSRIVIASPRVSNSAANSGPRPLRIRSPSAGAPGKSASGDYLFWRVDQLEPLRYSRQIKQALNLRGPLDDAQFAARLGDTLVGADDDAQPGRVHELEPAEVEHQLIGIRAPDLVQLLLELRARCEVEFARHPDDRYAALDPHVYPKVILHAEPSLLTTEALCKRNCPNAQQSFAS